VSPSPANVATSVRARLLEGARAREEDFSLVLQRYAAERFLYRLGESPHRERLVLKGAMLFAIWGGSLYRSTRDLDLTGYGDPEIEFWTRAVRDICEIPCSSDGIRFDPKTVRAEPIRDEDEYGGFRVRLEAGLAGARIRLRIDIGFGNAVFPAARDEEYPVLVEGPERPRIRAYPPEAVIAEKFHAMVVLGSVNSRMKDFYDLFVLAARFAFEGDTLARAVGATFERRSTAVPEELPVALSAAFYADEGRATMWRRYLERNGLPGAPADFGEVGESLRAFLEPPLRALAGGQEFQMRWQAGGPWA